MTSYIDCSVEVLFPDAKTIMTLDPLGYAVNTGGPYGIDTKSPIWDVVDDPLEVRGCVMVLTKFLDGSPVAVRYYKHDVYKFNIIHWGCA